MDNKTTTLSNETIVPHIPSREEWHKRFGGSIYESDYSDRKGKNAYGGSKIASHIAFDFRFDEQCAKNIRLRENNTVYGY